MKPTDALAALLLALAAPAGATCTVTLAETPSAVAFGYDPFDVQPVFAPLRLLLNNRGPATVLEFVFASATGPALGITGPGGTLALALRESGAMRPAPGAEGVHFLLDVEAAGEGAVDGFRFAADVDVTVGGAPVPLPGAYAGDIQIEVRDAATREPCGERFRAPVSVLVPARAQVNIAGTSGPITPEAGIGRVDFGTLETGEERQLFLQLRANGPARIRISSREGGVMRHTTLPAYGAPYALLLDGTALDLGAPHEQVAPPAATVEGISLPMLIRVGEVGGLPAGQYEDLVTVSISAL